MRIAFWGNFGTLNLGNECTLAAALHAVRRRLPGAELTTVCSDPADAALRHGVRGIPISSPGRGGITRLPRPLRMLRRIGIEAAEWWRAIAAARRFDALLVTGTGILTDSGEGTFGMPYQLFKCA